MPVSRSPAPFHVSKRIMPLDTLSTLASDLRHALDPVAFAQDRFGFEPDDWQAEALRSPSRRMLLNCSRQSGKSTTTAIIALQSNSDRSRWTAGNMNGSPSVSGSASGFPRRSWSTERARAPAFSTSDRSWK